MITRRSLIALPAALALTAGVGSAFAATLSADDRSAVARVESYLQGLRTLQADFVQRTDQGGYAEGRFYLDRPGKMRIEYNDEPHLYIANGFWLTFYDLELGQRSDVRQSRSLAGLITRADVRLSGDIRVTDVIRADGRIGVEVVRAEDPSEGRLTLVVREDPLELERWIIRDAQGVTTEVELRNLQVGGSISRSRFQTPQQFRR